LPAGRACFTPELSGIRRRHDSFLKLLYRAGARDVITLFFPDLAIHIDWERLQWIEKEVPILGERPRSIVADLVGLTQDVEGRYLNVLIHPEIQMQAEPDIGWRMLQYNAGLLLQQAHPDTRVLSFVFYHGAGAGAIREQIHGLEFYGHTIHQVKFWTVALGDLDAAEYAESENPIAWAPASWMRQPQSARVELRLQLLAKIVRFVRDEAYRRLLLDAVRTYFTLNRAEQTVEEQMLLSGPYREVREMLHTELSKLERAAERRGRAEGKAEGERVALQGALIEFVQSRFPGAPESIAARIRAIHDRTILKDLIRRAAVADTLEELEPLLGLSPS
jgi:hypothetical protein